MIKFSKEKVLLLHQLIVAETGGANEVRDSGLLESALEGAYATFDGKDLYPTKQEKAARIGYSRAMPAYEKPPAPPVDLIVVFYRHPLACPPSTPHVYALGLSGE